MEGITCSALPATYNDRMRTVGIALLLLATVAFGQQPKAAKGSSSTMDFMLSSPAFSNGNPIPDKYTCQGPDVSPVMAWTGHHPQALSFAIVMDDPDAPAGTWVHWVLWNIPTNAHLLPEIASKTASLEGGAVQGRNSFGKLGYNGPCPPPGKTHRYFFRLYALDTKLGLPPGATRKELDGAMKGHILGTAEHMGTYRR